jgi:hypothetical protein
MSSRDDRDVVWAAVGFGFGIWAFFRGFKELRRKRLIENTPTSTVRGLAMGLVELIGVVRPTTILRSPITKTECAAYKFMVEEYRSSGKSGRWVTLVQSDSFSCPFYLEDSTGKVKVYPFGSEMYWQPDYEFKNSFGQSFPENLNIFMLEMGISSRNWLFTKRMRFTEWYLRDNSPIYVLGTAKLDDVRALSVDQNTLADRLEKLKKDPEFLKEADTDQNGTISAEEWEAAAARVEKRLLSDAMAKISLDNAEGVRIAREEGGTPFIIAREDQQELINKLSWECIKCVWGGPVLSLACLAYLLWRLPMIFFK